MTKQVWKCGTLTIHASHSFTTWEYFFSASVSDLDTKPIGFSKPSAKLCDNIALIPSADTSQDKTMGSTGSKCTRIICEDSSKILMP